MGFLSQFMTSRDPYPDAGVALDIGTAFVKALIFEVKHDKAYIVGVGRSAQKLTDMTGGAVSDIQGVIKNCEAALEAAAKQAGFLPTQTIMGMAGELVKGTKTTVEEQRRDPKKKIDHQELKDIIGAIQKKAFHEARKQLVLETGHEELDVRLVHAAIVDVRIDGYKVNNPVGFQGKVVEVGIFNVFAPIIHLGALQTIADELDLDLLSIVAEPYAVARAQGSDAGAEYSAIFIDIGGGTTDVAVVRNGGIEGTKMFALGGRAFTKRLANTLGIQFVEAEETKLTYSAGKLTGPKLDEVATSLLEDGKIWLAGVQLTLEEFTKVDVLPNRILLCGGGSALPEIVEVLRTKDWIKELPFGKAPTVHFLQPHDLGRVKDETGDLRDPSDVTPMALANLAVELIGSEPVVEGLLARVVQGLRK